MPFKLRGKSLSTYKRAKVLENDIKLPLKTTEISQEDFRFKNKFTFTSSLK